MSQEILVWLLIEQEGAVLFGRRKPDRPPCAGLWTLPGDTMPGDESAAETIARFAREQLDVTVRSETFFDTLSFSDDGNDYDVNVFRVTYVGRPRFRESGPYTEVRWALPADLDDPPSIPIPEALRASLSAQEGRSST